MALKKQLSWQYLMRQTTCTLYKPLARPILTYGSEGWPLKSKDENMLQIFERSILSWCWVGLSMGFGLVFGFIDHLHIVATSNHSTIANLHTLQTTRAHAKSSQSVFTGPFLVMSSAYVFTGWWISNNWLSFEICPTYDPSIRAA
jgi:hypothetical protein